MLSIPQVLMLALAITTALMGFARGSGARISEPSGQSGRTEYIPVQPFVVVAVILTLLLVVPASVLVAVVWAIHAILS